MRRASWAPEVTRHLMATRAAVLVVVIFCAFGLFLSRPMAPSHALALALIVGAVWGLVHLGVEYFPEDDEQGSVVTLPTEGPLSGTCADCGIEVMVTTVRGRCGVCGSTSVVTARSYGSRLNESRRA